MSEEIIKFEEVKSDSLSRRAEWIAKRDELNTKTVDVTAVRNDSELEYAGKLQTDITRLLKDLEAARMALTRPIDARKKEIMEQEKTLAASLERELFRLKKLNGEYATKKAAEAEAARKLAEAERMAEAERQMALQREQAAKAEKLFGASATFSAPAPQAPAVEPVRFSAPAPQAPKTTSNKFVETWKFEVVDKLKVPREFLEVNESVIRQWLSYQKGLGADIATLQVEGLRLYKEVNVQSK